jgi:hypothetical protein
MECSKYLLMFIKIQLQIGVNFLLGDIHNLDCIELGNNVRVAFLEVFYHIVRDDYLC